MVNGKKNIIMKNILTVSLMAILTVCGCQVKELNEVISVSKSFTATIEDNLDGAETRTSLDENGNVRWKRGDQVSIFAGSTVNEQYQVTDASDGKTSAGFNKVTGSGFVGGGEIDNNVAFYPYAASAEIAKNGSAYVISDVTLPAVQHYAEDSFGNGAFPMVAVTNDTDDMLLKFKNVLGGLKLQLKGTATISSIRVTGNNNEILCGAAEVTVSNTTTPAISLTDATAKTVMLNCGDGVHLDPETATMFIIALPPMTMEDGFTVVVTDTEGKQMEIKTTKSQTINRSKLLKMPVVEFVGTPVAQGLLMFTSVGETGISLSKVGSPDPVYLMYKVNDGSWMSYSVGTVISLTDGENVSFKAGAVGNVSFGKSTGDYYKFIISGSGRVDASGNIMFLLNQNESTTIPSAFCFYRLFSDCGGLISAPELPATSLAEWCYGSMFSGCTSLISAPELPATSLTERCYQELFRGCSSLTTAPILPATILADYCYCGMFYSCSSLTSTPSLPATSLAEGCYTYMFDDCKSLTSAPELPATSLAHWCYGVMFRDCTSLTIAPELPATTLVDYCYESMFRNCSSLSTVPTLPATVLADNCYESMFAGCTSLNYIKCLATDISANSCLSSWVDGVSSTGVFIKDPNMTWPNGNSGIPEGWTVYPTGLPAEAEAVDLGLSVKWANLNIGATRPEEFGGYFAWGETEIKSEYELDTYKWYKGYYTKYCTDDYKTTLNLDDDAAYVNWGGTWRTPTRKEIEELLSHCSKEEISVNGVKGYRLTSLVEGYSDNSIFIPAAGAAYFSIGSGFLYWTSELNIGSYTHAYRTSFTGNWYLDMRYHGYAIRPVCK